MTPPIQKRKHRKYRKKKTIEEKKKLTIAIKFKEKQLFHEKLFMLPLDIKKKIFHLAIISNMQDWESKHRVKYMKTIKFLELPGALDPQSPTRTDHKKDQRGNKYIRFYELPSNENESVNRPLQVIFKANSICKRKVKERGQEGIKDLKFDNVGVFVVTSGMVKEVVAREWSNKEGYYWYHKKCRCKVCDRVRYLGYSKLNHSEKGKYNHIIWDNKKNQWNTKSKNQIRYEKEQKRKKNRR